MEKHRSRTYCRGELDKRYKKLCYEMFKTDKNEGFESPAPKTDSYAQSLGKEIVNLSKAISFRQQQPFQNKEETRYIKLPMKSGFLVCKKNLKVIQAYEIEARLRKNAIQFKETNRNVRLENRLKNTISLYIKRAKSQNLR